MEKTEVAILTHYSKDRHITAWTIANGYEFTGEMQPNQYYNLAEDALKFMEMKQDLLKCDLREKKCHLQSHPSELKFSIPEEVADFLSQKGKLSEIRVDTFDYIRPNTLKRIDDQPWIASPASDTDRYLTFSDIGK